MRLVVRCLMVAALAGLAALIDAGPSEAQTYRFRLDPFCNKVTLSLVASTSNSVLGVVGYDDFCGDSPHPLPIYGSVIFHPDGSFSIGYTTSAPSALVGSDVAVQTNVVWSSGALTGVWSDDDGNTGTFVFDILDQPSGIAPAGAATSAPRLPVR